MSEQTESRPPSLEDLLGLCRELNSRGAHYVVVGGIAMVQHGFVRATEDIDLLIEASIDNEQKVISALTTLADGAAKEIRPGEISQYEVIRVADEIVVDLMSKACGVDFAHAKNRIVQVEIERVSIPFASVDLMIELKQGIRDKDRMDLEFLKKLKAARSGS